MPSSREMRRQMRRVKLEEEPGAAEQAWRRVMYRRICRGRIRIAASMGKKDRAAAKWLAGNPETPEEKSAAGSYRVPKDRFAGLARRVQAAKELTQAPR